MMGAHPCPGARPGETIAIGPGYRWIAYATEGVMVAACYSQGGLMRRDLRGWWVAGFLGERLSVKDPVVAGIVGTGPDGWPMLQEQVGLAETEEQAGLAETEAPNRPLKWIA